MSGSSNCTQASPSVLPLKTEDYNCKLDIGYWNFSTFRFFLMVAQNLNQAMNSNSNRKLQFWAVQKTGRIDYVIISPGG
jgi:hypothetical protein